MAVAFGSITADGHALPLGTWQLVEYRFGGEKVERPVASRTTLVVNTDGKLGGNSGCNVYGGTYSVEKGKLKITDVISTMMACDEPSPQFERAFFDLLQNTSGYKLRNGKLTIFGRSKSEYLRFKLADQPTPSERPAKNR